MPLEVTGLSHILECQIRSWLWRPYWNMFLFTWTSHTLRLRSYPLLIVIYYAVIMGAMIQDSRFKIALLLPIRHSIQYSHISTNYTYIPVKNATIYYHGSKGSWKSCRIYGLLVCFTFSKYVYFNRGAKGATEFFFSKWHKMTLPVIIHQQHM